MADIIFPDETLAYWYADIQAIGRVFTAHLADNDVTPTLATVLSDFNEATYAGYLEQDLTAWAIPDLDPVTHLESAGWAVITFPNPTAGTADVYALYVTDESGHLRFALRLDGAPVTLIVGGVPLSLDLIADLSSRLSS